MAEKDTQSSVGTIARRVAGSLAASRNDPQHSMSEMIPHVYKDLRRLGQSMMRTENEVTLQATAVVNEAYLRLAEVDLEIHDQKHCFRLIAQTMRRVLIDHGKARCRFKRDVISKDELEVLVGSEHSADLTAEMIDFDIAMEKLMQLDSEAAEIVQLSGYFGMDIVELEQIFGISEATVTRKLRFGKSCLVRFLEEEQHLPKPASVVIDEPGCPGLQ